MSLSSPTPDLTALIYAVNEALRPLQPPGNGPCTELPTVEAAERLVRALRAVDDAVATVHPGLKDAAE